MKLHLPKQLLTALLAAVVMAPATTFADSVSVNFYEPGANDERIGTDADGGILFGVNTSDWNDVTGAKDTRRTVTLSTADEQTLNMVLYTSQASWGDGNAAKGPLEQTLQASYLDVAKGNNWTVGFDTDWWITDLTFYMAGDGGTYTPLSVNGIDYVGGVDTQGSAAWGVRDVNSGSYSTVSGYDGSTAISDDDLNVDKAVRVHNVVGFASAENRKNVGEGRGSLAGMQVEDRTAEMVYTTTLGSAATLSEVAWSKQGVEGTTSLSSIAPEARYLSVAADAAGFTLNIGEAATIAGLQLTANTLTITGSTLTTGALHANSGTTLTMEAGIAGANLALSGLGTIKLNEYNYSGGIITIASGTTVELLAGQKTGKIENSGTVLIDAGSSEIQLYKLIGKGGGNICASEKIANTALGNIIIEHTGHKTTDGQVNVATGGTITLKGGSAAIGHVINLENNSALVFEDIDVRFNSGGQSIKGNYTIDNGATVTLNTGDSINYGDETQIWTVNEGGVLNIGAITANGDAKRQTLGRNFKLILNGGTVNGKADDHGTLDYYNKNEEGNGSTAGTIQVTKSSTLNAAVRARTGIVVFDVVGDDTTLTMGSSTDGVPNFAALTGGGVFTKTGSGTLLYKGAAFNHDLTISGGVFDYNTAENRTYSGTLSGNGTFRKSGTGTLSLTAGSSSIGTLNVAEGVVQISGAFTANDLVTGQDGVKLLSGASLDLRGKYNDLAGDGDGNKLDTMINLANKVDTQGDSFVLINGTRNTDETADIDQGGNVNQQGNLTLSSNVVVATNLNINGKGWATDGGGREFTITDGASLKIGTEGTGQLALITKSAMTIENGSVTAGLLKLGHKDGGTNNDYRGSMTVKENGSLKIQSVSFQGLQQVPNTLTLDGGRLEFTATGEVLASGKQGGNATGGKGTVVLNSGTLVAENSSWSMTGTNNISVSIGSVDVSIADEQSIGFGGILHITGSISHNSEGTLTFADGTSLFVSSDAFEHMTSVGLGVEEGTNGMGSIGYYLVSGTGTTTYGENISLTVEGGNEGYSFQNGIIVTQSQTYIINGEKSTADATTDSVFADASSYQVNAGGKFTLAGNMPERPNKTVAALLTSVTGTGTLLVTPTEITLASGTSVFEGDVQVESGSTLTLGDDQNKVIDFSSLNSIVLNGGNVKWNAKGGNLKQLTVKADSDWTIFDMAEGTTLSIGEVSVEKDATLTVNKTGNAAWKQWINIEALVGEGSVAINGPGSTNDGDGKVSSLVINSLEDFTGNLSITGRQRSAEKDRYNATVNTGLAGATLGSLSITGFGEPGESSTATFNVQGNTTIGSTSMAGATMVLDSGVVLTLGNDTTNSEHTLGNVKAAADGNVINLQAGAVLSAVSKTQDSGAITLKGSGTYSLTGSGMFRDNADAMALNVTGVTSSEWTGTVRLSNATMGALNVDDYAHAGSTVEFVGVTAWLKNESTRRAATVLLSKEEGRNGLIIHDNSVQTYQFGGKVKGEGDFTVQSKSEYESGFTFDGDISEWSGGFVVAQHTSSENAATMTVNLTGGGTLFAEGGKGVVMDRKGTLNVNIGNSGDSVMRGGIGFGDTTKTGTLNVTVQGNTRFEQDVTATRFVVNNGKSATIGGESVGIAAGSVSFSKQNATLSNVTVSGSSIAKTGGSAGSIAGADISLAELAAGSSFSISDMALSNVSVSAATADTAVNLTNVTSSAVLLAQGSFTMTNQAVVDFHGVEGSKACFTTDLLSGITLNNAGNAASLAVDLGDLADVADLQDGKTYDLSITLNGFTMMNYEVGTGLVFAADSWLGQLLAEHGATEYVSGSLEAPEAVASTSSVKVTYTDGGANVGTIVTITGLGEVVPEPTTATLSLLALMGLAARRRRK